MFQDFQKVVGGKRGESTAGAGHVSKRFDVIVYSFKELCIYIVDAGKKSNLFTGNEVNEGGIQFCPEKFRKRAQ